MAKRFTDTDKYKKPFMRGLQGPYKVLWDYLYHDCNHAGIWIVDFVIAQIYLGSDMPVNKAEALKYFNDGETRIIEIDRGKKWFIPSFIAFQYGSLNETNKAHKSVLQILETYNLHEEYKGLANPLEGAKDKDRVKKKEIVKDKERGGVNFDSFWNIYDKKVDRKAAEPKWDKLTIKEQKEIMTFLPSYITSTPDKAFRRDPLTFLSRRTWENEIVTSPINNKHLLTNRNDSDFD